MGMRYRRLRPSEAAQIESPRDYHFQIWNDYFNHAKDNSYEHLIFYCNEEEIARVELDLSLSANAFRESSYPVGEIETPIVEIQFIDVRSRYRLKGFGTKIIETLEDVFPSATLAAFSEAADGFWQSVGWLRIDPQESMRRTLFLGPPKATQVNGQEPFSTLQGQDHEAQVPRQGPASTPMRPTPMRSSPV